MISLKQTWQQQRQQRQQEVVQRQQQVQETLAELRQTRQQQALHMHQNLQAFQQQLQQQTQNFLSVCAADRTLMSQQLNQELDSCRQQLHHSVATLRQTLQAQLRQLQADGQSQLHGYQQARCQAQLESMQNLAEYIKNLRVEVQAQLTEFSIVRQGQAQQLRQMLREDGDRRRAEVTDLFQELSEFRAELRTYCAELRQFVWGGSVTVVPAMSEVPVCPQAVPLETINPAAKSVVAFAKSSSNLQVTEAPQPDADLDEATGALPIAKVLEPSEAVETTVEAARAVDSSASTSLEESASSKEPISLEELVYIYLSESRGASLTGIETALKINRFQSVQALRSLIRKGLVTQRDRMYLIQEEVKL